jgi:hypothetical protein
MAFWAHAHNQARPGNSAMSNSIQTPARQWCILPELSHPLGGGSAQKKRRGEWRDVTRLITVSNPALDCYSLVESAGDAVHH